jgi:hypothetical protein
MARFVEVARVEDVPPGTATVVRVGGAELALVNVDGTSRQIAPLAHSPRAGR